MNALKRIYLSIIRRKSKSLTLFLVVFIVGNVFCTSIILSNSLIQQKNMIISQLGNKIDISLNGYLANNEANNKNIENLIENLDFIDKKDYVKYYDKNYVYEGMYANLIYRNDKVEINSNSLNLFLYGTDLEKLTDLMDGNIKLIDGRTFSSEEIEKGKNVVIVSDEFYYQDRLIKTGDKLLFESKVFNEKNEVIYNDFEEFEVIGIYKKSTQIKNSNQYSVENLSARIYIPNQTLFKQESKILDLYNVYDVYRNAPNKQLYKIQIKLNEPKDLYYFESIFNYNNELLLNQKYVITTSKDVYENFNQSLNSLSTISKILVYISSAVIIVFINIEIFLYLKEKKNEIGILFALGERKIIIVRNIMCEIIIVVLLAITFSTFSSSYISNLFNDKIIDNLENSKQYIFEAEEILDNESTVINMDINNLIDIYGMCCVTSIVSSIWPTVYILKFNPKKILL